MRSVIERVQAALGECPLSANVTEDLSEYATYDQYTTSYDGIKRRVTFKLRIHAPTMARALELEEAVDHALIAPGDLRLTPTLLDAARNGGGWLTDGELHVRIAYYELLLIDNNVEVINNEH